MDRDAFQAELEAFVGAEAAEPFVGPDPVNEPMIRHWCEAVGDLNPVYTDAALARESVHGGIVAPPTMLQAWTMPGLRRPPPSPGAPAGPQARLFARLDAAGFTSVVATNSTQEYRRYLRPGDRIRVRMQIESISPEKQTALGAGHFVTQRLVFEDAAGEEVARMSFRMLKFRPRAAQAAAAAPPAAAFPRPRPGITHDSRFFWEGLAEGRLLIQRCSGCGRLRHPPGPACPACRSLAWETQEASGRGHVYSFVFAHHPPLPAFPQPNPIALVELEEGTRLVANVEGVAHDALRIGLAVECRIREVEPGFRLPVFVPREAD